MEPASVCVRNSDTLLPSHWNASKPNEVFSTRIPSTNCIPRPQSTGRHRTYGMKWEKMVDRHTVLKLLFQIVLVKLPTTYILYEKNCMRKEILVAISNEYMKYWQMTKPWPFKHIFPFLHLFLLFITGTKENFQKKERRKKTKQTGTCTDHWSI